MKITHGEVGIIPPAEYRYYGCNKISVQRKHGVTKLKYAKGKITFDYLGTLGHAVDATIINKKLFFCTTLRGDRMIL